MRQNCWLKVILYTAAVFSLLPGLSSCAQQPETRPRIWIDSPDDGAPIPSGTNITIVSHAYARQGIAEVLLSINGETYRRDAPGSPGTEYVQVSQDWQPPGDGIYAVEVQAYDVTGQMSIPDLITVRVGAMSTPPTSGPAVTVTPAFPVTADITVTPTAPIQFWADPAEVKAGACTSIHWRVNNAGRVIFGGIDQPFEGSYEDCLCANQRYTLTVIRLDGTEEKRSMEIPVNGVCETPIPPQDSTPPPAPSPMVPANGLTVTCRGTQNLVWLPVTDPSGVEGYYVLLDRRASLAENWVTVHKSNLLSDKQYTVNVQCGWYYRWGISAQDGAGNLSGWSDWSNFTVTLE